MSKRSRQLEKEAREQGLTPTKDLEVDESGLSEEEKGHTSFPWTFIIIAGVIILAMVAFLIVELTTGGPIPWNH